MMSKTSQRERSLFELGYSDYPNFRFRSHRQLKQYRAGWNKAKLSARKIEKGWIDKAIAYFLNTLGQ